MVILAVEGKYVGCCRTLELSGQGQSPAMISPNSPTIWDVYLSSWIIQDGNYPDFEIGQTPEFAVEFWLPDGVIVRTSDGEKSANSVGGPLYDTTAEIVFQNAQITILDIGILVYRQTSSSDTPLSAASRVEVQLGLGVDPFFYFEDLNKIADVPPLVYSWKILNILRQTAPFIEQVAEEGFLKGRTIHVRDERLLGYEEIPRTDAWNDDDGHAEYLLRCQLLPLPPKFSSATAT